jgi:hypothetical protein
MMVEKIRAPLSNIISKLILVPPSKRGISAGISELDTFLIWEMLLEEQLRNEK